MSGKKLTGVVLLVVGIGLLIWGYRLSGSIGSQLSEALSGSPSDKVMILYIGGAASLITGFFMLIKK